MPELGYIEDRNLLIEWRFADGDAERLPDLAVELVRLKLDVIVSGSSAAISALQKATTTIPIVMATSAQQMSGLAPKYLQLLKHVLPETSEVAIPWSPTNASSARFVHDANDAAAQPHIRIQAVECDCQRSRSRSHHNRAGATASNGRSGVTYSDR
jgi:putative ABC transport system substrate-binding protein